MSEHQFNPEHADILLSDERHQTIPPEEVLSYLNIDETDKVADLGCGNGFFTLPIARKTNEMVTAVDAQEGMIEQLQINAEAENIENVRYLISHLERIHQPDESVNKILSAFVLHEVDDLEHTLLEIKRILKPDGKVLLVDWKAKETESGPPLHIRISEDDLLESVREAGFKAYAVSVTDEHYGILAELEAEDE